MVDSGVTRNASCVSLGKFHFIAWAFLPWVWVPRAPFHKPNNSEKRDKIYKAKKERLSVWKANEMLGLATDKYILLWLVQIIILCFWQSDFSNHPRNISAGPVQCRAFDVAQYKPFIHHFHELNSWQAVLRATSAKRISVLLKTSHHWCHLWGERCSKKGCK